MKKCIVYTITVIIYLVSQFGCGIQEEKPSVSATDSVIRIDNSIDIDYYGLPIRSNVKLENMYEQEAVNLEKHDMLELITVIDGIDKVSIKVKYMGVRNFGLGFPLYEFELSDPIAEKAGGIAGGMSGSPVGPKGFVMGALAYGNSFDAPPYRFWATSIDAMENARNQKTFGEFMNAPNGMNNRAAPIGTEIIVTGSNNRRIEYINNRLKSTKLNNLNLVSDIGGAPAQAPLSSNKLEAGDMIGVALATGDIVDVISYGTVTQVYDDNTFVAFGHSMEFGGKSAIPVYRATTSGIVSNVQRPYKSAVRYGKPIGMITKDVKSCIVGEIGETPETIDVYISYHPINSKNAIKTSANIAYGHEWVIAPVVSMTIDSLRAEYTNGTSKGEFTVSFEETDKTYTHTWHTISEDPFFDTYQNISSVIDKFTNTLINNVSKATLKSIDIEIEDMPQIQTAEIVEIVAPEEIDAGNQLDLTIVILMHWTIAEDENRRVEKHISLDIPSNFSIGLSTIEAGKSDYDNYYLDEPEYPSNLETLDEVINHLESELTVQGEIKVVLQSVNNYDMVQETIILEDIIIQGNALEIIDIE